MKRYLATLRPLIDDKKLSIASLALRGFDKIAGFEGIHLHDEFAELFFMNQCLGFVKGFSSLTFFQRLNEILWLPPSPGDGSPTLASSILRNHSSSFRPTIYRASTVVMQTIRRDPPGDKMWLQGLLFH